MSFRMKIYLTFRLDLAILSLVNVVKYNEFSDQSRKHFSHRIEVVL